MKTTNKRFGTPSVRIDFDIPYQALVLAALFGYVVLVSLTVVIGWIAVSKSTVVTTVFKAAAIEGLPVMMSLASGAQESTHAEGLLASKALHAANAPGAANAAAQANTKRAFFNSMLISP